MPHGRDVSTNILRLCACPARIRSAADLSRALLLSGAYGKYNKEKVKKNYVGFPELF